MVKFEAFLKIKLGKMFDYKHTLVEIVAATTIITLGNIKKCRRISKK